MYIFAILFFELILCYHNMFIKYPLEARHISDVEKLFYTLRICDKIVGKKFYMV